MPVARTRKPEKTPEELRAEVKLIYKRARQSKLDMSEFRQLVRAASLRTGGRGTLLEITSSKRTARARKIRELISAQHEAHRKLHKYVGEPVEGNCDPCKSRKTNLVKHWKGCVALEKALWLAKAANSRSGRLLKLEAPSAKQYRGEALLELYRFGRPMTLTWREVAILCVSQQKEVLDSDRVGLEMNRIHSVTQSAKRRG